MSQIRLRFPPHSIPANAENSSKRKQCRLSANAAVAAEIPAFAGMEEGREWE